MLKDSWYIKQKSCGNDGTDWHFQCSKDEDYMILVLAPTESEAWKKLGVLLNENVETEVFEGVISSCSFSSLESAFVTFKVSQDCATSLLKLMNKKVDVQLKLRDR